MSVLSLCKESQKLLQLHSASHWELVTCGWLISGCGQQKLCFLPSQSVSPPISLAGFLRVLEREELGRIFNYKLKIS